MVARNVIKNLAVAEDILHGVGQTTQLRNGEVLTVRRVDIPVGLNTEGDLVNLDPSLYPRARVGNTEFEYLNGTWKRRIVIAPYLLVSGLQLDDRYNQVIKDGIIAEYIGTLPYTTTGLEDITEAPWRLLCGGGGSGGGGIEYAVPSGFTEGKTFFNPETFELAMSYEDESSSQYVTFPLVNNAVQAEGGGEGGGIVYEVPTPSFVSGTTLFNPETFELVFSYSDLDSAQYVTFPMTAGMAVANSVVDGVNLGAGATVFASKSGDNLQFKTLVAGSNVTLTDLGNTISIASTGGGGGGGGGEVNTASNLGAGTGIFASKAGTDLQFKSLVAGTNMSITNNSTTVTLNTNVTALAYTAITTVPTNSLLGRDTAGTGNAESIAIGANLTLSGNVLSATGGASLGAALTALDTLTPAADRLPYFTGASAAALAVFTSLARSLVAQTTGAQMLSQLGITYTVNANGTSVRIPIPGIGGVQICWRNNLATGAVTTVLGSAYVSANVSWTYPQAFSAEPTVTGSVSPGAFTMVGGTIAHTATVATVRGSAPISDAGGGIFNLIAIGVY